VTHCRPDGGLQFPFSFGTRLIISCLTPASRCFIEKLIVAQLGKKFTAFYEIQIFIAVFGRTSLSLLAMMSHMYAFHDLFV